MQSNVSHESASLALGGDNTHAEFKLGGADRHFITALARGLEVLRCFSSGEEQLGNQQLAERCRLPKSTITRLTHTLTALGYLHHERASGRYRLGMAALSIGGATLARLAIKDTSRPIMEELAHRTGLQIALGVRDRLAMVYVESSPGKAILSPTLEVGSKIPLATTAMGRACLASLAEPVRLALEQRLAARDPSNWLAVQRGISKAIADFAIHGCCTSFSQWKPEVHGIAVPLSLGHGLPEMALSAAGPATFMAPARYMSEVRPLLIEAVAAVKQRLRQEQPSARHT